MTDDGDISSATGNTARSAANQPHQYRAPVPTNAVHAQGSTDSSPPSPGPGHSPHLVPSRHPGHGASGEPAAWAAAPQGFLSNMSASDIQVRRNGEAWRLLLTILNYRITSLLPSLATLDEPTPSNRPHKDDPFESTPTEFTTCCTVRASFTHLVVSSLTPP